MGYVNRKYRKKFLRPVYVVSVFGLIFLYFGCKYGIYYASVMQCAWPDSPSLQTSGLVRFMLVADPHLAVSKQEYNYETIFYEWQMYQAFQTAVLWHKPDVVFVMGDIFDNGINCSDSEFQEGVKKFNHIFKVPEGTKVYVVPGNHDLGYHEKLVIKKVKRFEDKMMSPPVGMISIRDVHFVLINSMAMEGDGCWICARASQELQNISDMLRCAAGYQFCKIHPKPNINYSHPVVIQHFPLYRGSDSVCLGEDSAPKHERERPFMERRDCLSKESTLYLVDLLRPRFAFGAHSHGACLVRHAFVPDTRHKYELNELTVPSFSWRFRRQPMYYLVSATKDNVSVEKCRLHDIYTVATLGAAAGVLWLVVAAAACRPKYAAYRYTEWTTTVRTRVKWSE